MADLEIKAEISLMGDGYAHFIGFIPVSSRDFLGSIRKFHFCTDAECIEKSRTPSPCIDYQSYISIIQPQEVFSQGPLSHRFLELVAKVENLLQSNIMPQKCGTEATGGVWFFTDNDEKTVAIFKPCGEEAGVKCGSPPRRGIAPGDGAIREFVVNFLSNSEARVPVTVLVSICHPFFGDQPCIGSLQEFMNHDCPSWDMGPSFFSVEDVHSLGVIDIRFLNTDRHGGNILVTDTKQLIPIDHTYCLPETLDETWFEWMQWRQARKPFSTEMRSRILSFDIEGKIGFLRSCRLSEKSIFNYVLSNFILKECATRNYTLFNIWMLCSRIIMDKPAPIEEIAADYEKNYEKVDFRMLECCVKQYLDSHSHSPE